MKNLSLLLAVLALVGVGALFLLEQTPPLAGSQEFVTQSFYNGIRVGAIGGATENSFIRELHCTSVNKDVPDIIAGTSTAVFGIPFTGVNTSTKQVYSVGFVASSTANNRGFLFIPSVTSTDSLQLNTFAAITGSPAQQLAITACYTEFTTSTLEARF